MPKFNVGDEVKIVHHLTKPEYCGLKGKIAEVYVSPKPNTRGIGCTAELPEIGRQWTYVVQIESLPTSQPVTGLIEDWLESAKAD